MLAAAIALVLATAAPADLSRPRLQLHLQVEPDVRVSADDLDAVAAGVRRIWSPVLELVVSRPGDVHGPIAVDTVRVVLTNRMLDDVPHTGLAWIGFVNGEPQPHITVSVAAVRRLQAQGTWHGRPFTALPAHAATLFLQRALTRALAHEVGHYLLRSTAHTGGGLMRAVFTVDELMDTRPSVERLDRESVERLRQHDLVARADAEVNREGSSRPMTSDLRPATTLSSSSPAASAAPYRRR